MSKKQKPKSKPKRWLLKLIIVALLVCILLVGIVPLIKLDPGAHPSLVSFVETMTSIRDHLSQYYGLYMVLLTVSSALFMYLKKLGGKHK